MNLSKSVRAQLGALALVLSVVEQIKVRLDNHAAELPGLRKALARLALDRDYCWQDTVTRYRIPYRVDDHGTRILQLDPKNHAHWKRYTAELHGQVLFALPAAAQRPDNSIDAHAWLNAVLIRVQAQADQIPWSDKPRTLLWQSVVGSLQALYEQYDPELDNTEAMRQGSQWAEGLRV